MKSNANFFSIPYVRFAAVLLFEVLFIVGAIYLACLENNFSVAIEPGMKIQSVNGEMVLQAIDLSPEPGDLPQQSDYDNFLARQDQLAKIIQADVISVSKNDQVTEYKAAPKAVRDLPLLFWIQIAIAFGITFISGLIWALKPKHLPTTFFFLSGLALGLSVFSSAVYTTRFIAIPMHIFKTLSLMNAWGAPAFGLTMICVFLIYPREVRHWKKLIFAASAFFLSWTFVCTMNWGLAMRDISIAILIMIVLLAAAIICQFVLTKKDPKSRAILYWVGLSVLFGCITFIAFNTVPVLLGLKPLEQGYAFLPFLLVYVGIAFGLKQYRLFEVGEWAYRFLFYAAGTVLLVVLDAGLIYLMGISRIPAIGIAITIVGFLYLPLRDYFWRRFSNRKEILPHELLNDALNVTLAPSEALRLQRWEALVKKVYDPLEIQYCNENPKTVLLDSDGVTLTLPAIAEIPSLKLSYPWAGRSLFSLRALEVAKQIVTFVEEAESSRQAYDRGVTEERMRIARDLHDDVGARLLTGLHGDNSDLRSTIQGAMADIRSIVKGIAGEKVLLSDLMADLRAESHRRLQAVGIEMQWALPEKKGNELAIDYHLYKTLNSVIREIVSNTIKHATAKKLEITVNVSEEQISISSCDDGKGFPESVMRGELGFGLKGMTKRVTDLGGKFEIKNSPKACIHIYIPPKRG